MLRKMLVGSVLFTSLLATGAAGPASAAPPWATLVPFKRVDADPHKVYELTESNGPWLIMCTSFAGPTAEQQAHDLVLELRQRFKIEAYSFRQTFDFSQPDPTDGIGFDQFGERKKMRYLHPAKFDEIAVMAGNFASVEGADVDKTLDLIKHAKPASLGEKYKDQSSQRFAGLRSFYRTVTLKADNRQKGPMGAAFVTRNPLLPEEYFNAKGLDPFLVEINKDIEHSLLKCPGNYTVRVATFRGVDTMKPAEFERLTSERKGDAKIDQAAMKASALCAALRARGVEAYEFHDRTESMVTVGSFNEYGQPRADGKIEINPAIHRLMQEFGPVKRRMNDGSQGVQARMEPAKGYRHGIPFDPQPWPVQVPRESAAAAYNQSQFLDR
ncbi:MAG: hypothetical protein L0211_22350 [Planctomycetaceae bacterium]|nr:hypothetical protein [Planctomycetaceae bacterium]